MVQLWLQLQVELIMNRLIDNENILLSWYSDIVLMDKVKVLPALSL